MDDISNHNAGLMRRIVQLETEKGELQRDIETLCMQQSGFSGSTDIISRMQTRRAAGFEQELEACKQQLALHTKENLNQREELAEAFRAKGRVADAFKAAMDKNKELEKEVKFYQSRMAGAFSERDKALLEVERLRNNENSTINELKEVRSRLEQTMAENSEQAEAHIELQKSVEDHIIELKRVQKVVDKFWQLRVRANGNEGLNEELVDKAQALLEDEDASWVYGFVSDPKLEDICKTAEHVLAEVKEELVLSKAASSQLEDELFRMTSASKKLEEELVLTKAAVAKLETELVLTTAVSAGLKLQVEEDRRARKDAEEKLVTLPAKLALKREMVEKELQLLRCHHSTLKTMIATYLDDEKRQVILLLESLEDALEKAKSEAKDEHMAVDVSRDQKGLRLHFEDEKAMQSASISKKEMEIDFHSNINNMDEESRQVLAQALHEKVEALLLLSQQEERYYLETSTRVALEAQVTELSEKLAQVTSEKVTALLELAEGRQWIQQLQEREREFFQQKGMIVHHAVKDKPASKVKQKSIASGGYLKGWLRGSGMSALKTTFTDASSSNTAGDDSSKTNNGKGITSLLVENAALRERVVTMQHLAKSAHHLRMKLVKVAAEFEGEDEDSLERIQSMIEDVESVKSEAKQLRGTLGCSLPVSFQGAMSISPDNSCVVPSSKGTDENGEGTQIAPDYDSASLAGIEMAELLVATANLQIESFLRRFYLLSTF